MSGQAPGPLGQTVARPTASSASSQPVLSCRQLADGDIEAAIRLLSEGFPERDAAYWRRALERLRDRTMPAEWPRFGYVMTDRNRLVGIILLIFAEADDGAVRGNVSSWYVEPAYRGYSHILLAAPLRLKATTLFNISPAPTTHGTIAAQGFARYVDGTFIALAALCRPVPGARVTRVAAGNAANKVLAEHAAWGCLSFEVALGGENHPFVFVRRRLLGGRIPSAQLVYCRDVADFVRFAGPLGRRLLRHGVTMVAVDANQPLEGVPGFYRVGRGPRYYRGPAQPRVGDLSYTELPIFGA